MRKTFKPNSLKPVEYPYERPKLCEIENCDPLMVFEKVCNLDQLIELLISQSGAVRKAFFNKFR